MYKREESEDWFRERNDVGSIKFGLTLWQEPRQSFVKHNN